MTDGPDERERVEGQVVKHPVTGRYHVRLIRLRDGRRLGMSRESFATVEEADAELMRWIKDRGGRLEQ